MGLDITAYSKLEKLDVIFDAEDRVLDSTTGKLLERPYFHAYLPADCEPSRAGQVVNQAVYGFAQSYGFRAGSYSGYNVWRELLAQLAGYPAVPHEVVPGLSRSVEMRHDAAAWAGLCEGRPFVELVDFSDCEGIIGAAVAAKLAKDFADFDDKARARGPSPFYECYCHWRKAFELAADAGAVRFH